MATSGLDARIGELEKTLEKTLRERDEYRKLYELLSEEVDRLRRGLLGSKAERVDPSQSQLAFDAVRDLILAAVQRAEDSGDNEADDSSSDASGASGDATGDKGGSGKPGGAPSTKGAKGRTGTPHGRSKIPEHLPVERIEILPAEVASNPELFERIGEEVSETLERRSATLVRVLTVRPKFVVRVRSSGAASNVDSSCPSVEDARLPVGAVQSSDADGCCEHVTSLAVASKQCSPLELVPTEGRAATEIMRDLDATLRILIAELPARAVARCRAGPGLLAHVLVSKYADHIPWNRMEKIFARDGLELARSTLCDWSLAAAEALKPLVSAMLADAKRNAFCIAIDATGVMVQQKERCRWGHFWVLVADRDHVLFGYSRTHDQTVPMKLLAGYRGYLLADASSVYEALYDTHLVTEVACWAHTRRYFFKALPSDRERALAGMGFINKLFEIERDIASLPPARKLEERRRRSAPVVDAFEAWADIESLSVLPKAPITAALTYARNQRIALRRFMHDGRLRLDNNISELELRRQAVGRKNWLFVATDDGADANATIVSLVASCELHGLDPFAYLRDVLTVIATYPADRRLDLCPRDWRVTRQRLVAQGELPEATDAAVSAPS